MSYPVRWGVWWLGGVILIAFSGLGVYGYLESSKVTGLPEPEKPEPDELSNLVMPEEQREFLWEVEHHYNRMNQFGFKAFAQALKDRDEKGLEGMLAAEFSGQVYRAEEMKAKSNAVEVVRYTGQGPLRRVDRKEFLAELWALRRLFDKPKGVKLSVKLLSPAKRDDLDGDWKGTGVLRMWGAWQEGKPAEVSAVVQFRLRRPTPEALAAGGWLLGCDLTDVQVGKAERFLFREVAAARGLEPHKLHDNWNAGDNFSVNTGGVYVFDYDRDGILDVLVTDLNGVGLYKGLPGGNFKNVTAEMGLMPYFHGIGYSVAVIADLDGDGWDDLVLGRAGVFRNDGGKRFVNVSAQTNLRVPANALGAAVADYDRDGKLDLYFFRSATGKAGSWIDGKGGINRGNVLLRNKGNWQFEDVTAATGTAGDDRSTFSAVWLDANGDGWPDLYVINEFGNGVLYCNRGSGAFSAHALHEGPYEFGGMGVAAGDVFNSGNIDLYVGAMYSKAGSRVIGNMWPGTYREDVMAKIRTFIVGNRLHRNKGGLKFEEVGTKMAVNDAGWAYGPALADLDNDGWLDIFSTAGHISRCRDKPDG